jgi:hypothetical protein
MRVDRLWMIGAGGVLALIAPIAAIAAEDDQLLATVDKPATLTASPAKNPQGIADQPGPQVVVHVTGYQRPQEGAVRGVVKVQKPDGSEQQIGTFGVFPDAAFQAGSSRPRSYSFPLPRELASGPVKLKVEIVPDKPQGTGAGAQLEIGHAEIK